MKNKIIKISVNTTIHREFEINTKDFGIDTYNDLIPWINYLQDNRRVEELLDNVEVNEIDVNHVIEYDIKDGEDYETE